MTDVSSAAALSGAPVHVAAPLGTAWPLLVVGALKKIAGFVRFSNNRRLITKAGVLERLARTQAGLRISTW